MTDETQDPTTNAREQAHAQARSIVDMVAALQCDYERLEELRDERADLQNDVDESADDATHPAALATLRAWDADHGGELSELLDNAGDCESEDEARERIMQDPLTVEVRADWHAPGEVHATPSEFQILLCTGGPAVRIMGELDDALQPKRAWIEYQDWGTPWTHAVSAPIEQATLLAYCAQFYYGE